jgi:hypothetical protein
MHSYESWARMWGWKCDDCKNPVNGTKIGSKIPLNFNKAKRGANRHLDTLHPKDGTIAEDLMYKIDGDN